MVPTFKQLPELAEKIAEAIQGETILLPEEFKVVFYTEPQALQKINEDFFYSMGNNENGKKPEMVEEISVVSHGINFLYKEKEVDNG